MNTTGHITHAQLITLFEVSRKINSELNLDKLLNEIMDRAIKLLHAEKGLILFRSEETGELDVQLARSMDQRAMNEVVELSRSIIKKVESEGKPILLQNIPDRPGGHATQSMVRYKLKSVICVPLLSKNNFTGIIYLDTTDHKHFFKKEDLDFLEAFANLAAIAIENAKSYREITHLNTNLEKIVDERTRELKDTQLQLIRTEKMASLGQLVAGIAHEINTPLGSISSNTNTLLKALDKIWQQIDDNASAPDITRPMKVLDNLSKINKTACDRITTIVKRLRNFARLDEEEFKSVDIHEGIESTLTLIEHLCKNRIEVVKEYASLPKLSCYAGQLNQVFMNILVNACQAIPGTGRITIKTSHENNNTFIEISDTGVGIPPENLEKIFDPGFTTKGVGVGTGLGLSISYRIVADHGGTIVVRSEVGKGATFLISLPHNRQKRG